MSAHDPGLADGRANPGGAAVADLRAMDGEQALAVLLFRDSFAGPEGTARIRALFATAMGPAGGAEAFEAWSALLRALTRHARRPLVRHGLGCLCVGADEAALAQILRLAARGQREDAMLCLSLLMPGDRLMLAMGDAETAGRAVMRAARWHRGTMPDAPSRRLH